MSTAVSHIEDHERAATSQEGRRSIQQIVSDLSRPVADRHIRTRKQGGSTLSYIEWATAANYLDHFAPGWSWQIISVAEHVSGLTVVHGALSIPAAEGVVTLTPKATATQSRTRLQWRSNVLQHSSDLGVICTSKTES
jgi:hypothetical protein